MKLNVWKMVLLLQIIVLVRTDHVREVKKFKRRGLLLPLNGRFLDLYVRMDEKEASLLMKKKSQNGAIHLETIDSKSYPDNFPLDYREFEFTVNYLEANESLIICRNQVDEKPPCVLLPIVFDVDPSSTAKFGEYRPIVSIGVDDFKDLTANSNFKDRLSIENLFKSQAIPYLLRIFSQNGRNMITVSAHDHTKLVITRSRIDFGQIAEAEIYLNKTGTVFESVTSSRIIASFELDGYAYYFRCSVLNESRDSYPEWRGYLTRVCLDDSSRELKSQSTIALDCPEIKGYILRPSAAYFDRDDRKLYIYKDHATCEFEIRTIAHEFEQSHRRCYEDFSDLVNARFGEMVGDMRTCSYYKPIYASMERLGISCVNNDACNPPVCTKMYHLVNDEPIYGKVVSVSDMRWSRREDTLSSFIPTEFIVATNRELWTKHAFVRTYYGIVFMMFLNSSLNQNPRQYTPRVSPAWAFASKSHNSQLIELADGSGTELTNGDRLNSFKADCSIYTECRQLLDETNSEQARRLWKCGWCRARDGRDYSTNESECSKSRGVFLNNSSLCFVPVMAKCPDFQRWSPYETRTLTVRGEFPITFGYRIKVCGSECQGIERSGDEARISLTCFSTPPYPLLGSSPPMSSCGVELLVLNASDSSILNTFRPESCGGPIQLSTIHSPFMINEQPTNSSQPTTSHPPSTVNVPTLTPPPELYPPSDQSHKSAWYVAAGFVIFLIMLGIGYFLHRMRKRREKNRRRRADAYALPMVGPPDFRSDHDYVQPRSQTENAHLIRPITQGDYEPLSHLVPSKLLIKNDLIELERRVGKGHFGEVFKARYRPSEDQPFIQVGVKTILCRQNARQFLQEGMIMETFEHENVLSLIGISFKDDNLPMIITPFMTKGDLLTYIRHPQNTPDMNQLLTFGLEIAAGMQYLHKSKFIHRDLATRNCVLDDSLRVKVADFGFTRDVYETEAYMSSQTMEVPIRWMPPESIERKVYSYKSDVWSYGVALWELCTRGKIPYAGRSGFEVLSYLKSGHRLERFDTTPEEVDKLMRTCWMLAPDERPDFTTLVDRLPEVIDRLKATVLRVPPYYNTP